MGIAFLALTLQWSSNAGHYLEPTENLVSDQYRRMLASDTPDDRILVVDIDEASLLEIGPWPWPRFVVADLVERLLTDLDAKAVGLDIVFPSPAKDNLAGDDRLASLGENGPVVYAQAFDFASRHTPLETGVPVFSEAVSTPLTSSAKPIPATGYVANHKGLSKSRCVGNIGISPDGDGQIRRVPLVVSWDGRNSYLLPVAMMRCVVDPAQPHASHRSSLLTTGTGSAMWKVPFKRALTSYAVVSAADILSGRVKKTAVKGRWVLVGSSALGLNDRASTPLSPNTSGVMVHAAALTSLLDARFGEYPKSTIDGRWPASFWIVAGMLVLGVMLGKFRAWVVLPAVFLLVLSWMAVAFWLVSMDVEVRILPPLLGYFLVLLLVPVEWWVLQREQGRLLDSFATYVAPAVLQEMLRRGIQHPLEPQLRNITVLTADMQNYTGITRVSKLQDAAQLTREFLQCLTEPVLRCGGTLDKYTGDGLVAFWGAPLPSDNHSGRAIDAGKQVILSVRAWNEKRLAIGMEPVRVRVGIETGAALVGDLGTPFRRTYTAVGDCINLASKLQGLTRNRPFDLAIGPVAGAACASRGDLLDAGTERLPGASHPLQMWTIAGLPTSIPD